MVGIIETCIEASCSAVADILGGFVGSTGIIGTCIEPFFGEAPCGTLICAKACGVLLGK